MPFGLELFLDLWPKAVHENDLDAHRVDQCQVLRKGVELAGRDQLASDGDDECLAAMGMDVRCDRTEPRDKRMGEDQAHRGALK